MKILVINAGSSSLKYQLIDMDNEQMLAKGNCEKIGLEMGIFGHKTADGREKKIEIRMANHTEAFEHKFGLRIDMTRAAGYVFSTGQPALEVRVADCRANGIRIRIAVSDNKNWVHALMLLYVIRDGSPSESV